MEVELRIGARPLTEAFLTAGADSIGVGDEGCAFRFTGSDVVGTLARITDSGLTPRLVTPRVAQSELGLIAAVFRQTAELGVAVDVVVNDLGVLSLCRRIMPGARIYLGRVLARSIADCPWHRLALRNETDTVRQHTIRHGFDHRPKADICRLLNVCGVEAHNDAVIAASISQMTACGLDVRVHLGRRLLTLGRSCATARHLGKRPPECVTSCGQREFTLTWSGVYRSPTEASVPVTEQHTELLPELTVTGNRVLGEICSDLEAVRISGARGVIVDADGADDLAGIVTRITEEARQWDCYPE